MSRILPLNYRQATDGVPDDDVEVLLMQITHEDLETPIRLSTDPTRRLSIDPLVYATTSTWNGNGAPVDYLFVLVAARLPDDKEDEPASITLIVQAHDARLGAILRSIRKRARLEVAAVLASDPDIPMEEYSGMELVASEGDASVVQLTFSQEPLTAEPWPAGRMTRQRFPGLHA